MPYRTVAAALRHGPRIEQATASLAELIHLRSGHDADHLARLLVDAFIANYARWALREVDDEAFAERCAADVRLLTRCLPATDSADVR